MTGGGKDGRNPDVGPKRRRVSSSLSGPPLTQLLRPLYALTSLQEGRLSCPCPHIRTSKASKQNGTCSIRSPEAEDVRRASSREDNCLRTLPSPVLAWCALTLTLLLVRPLNLLQFSLRQPVSNSLLLSAASPPLDSSSPTMLTGGSPSINQKNSRPPARSLHRVTDSEGYSVCVW